MTTDPGDWRNGPLPRAYVERLAQIHALLRPRTYLEIGVKHGLTLRLAGPDTLAVGVDPEAEITLPLSPRTRVRRETSDAFFATRDIAREFEGMPIDLAFIDGMHLFEYALRDLINTMAHCGPAARIILHDTMPFDRQMALRERETDAWTGDVWKLVPCLRRHCPRLGIVTLDTAPTGLTIIANIDRADRALSRHYDAIVAEFVALDFAAYEAEGPALLNLVADDPRETAARLGIGPCAS